MSYIKYPYDKLGECSLLNDTQLTSPVYNGLGTKMRRGKTVWTLTMFFDSDERQQHWVDFVKKDLRNGVLPFLVKIPNYDRPLYHLVQLSSSAVHTTKTEEGWSQSVKVLLFYGDGVVFDENGEPVTDVNGDVITASEICENITVKYYGEAVASTNTEGSVAPMQGVLLPGGNVGGYSLCFDPENPLQNKHLVQVYEPAESKHMLAWYRFENNLWNHMDPPSSCSREQYTGVDTSEVSYGPARFKTGLHQETNPLNGLVVTDFPFVYTNSAISFWVKDITDANENQGNKGVIFKAFGEQDVNAKVMISNNTTDELTVSGTYFTTDAKADIGIDVLSKPLWSNIIVSFVPEGTARKCRIYVDGQDVTTQEGIMVSTLNNADKFQFALREAGETVPLYVDDLRFFSYAIKTEVVAQKIHNTGLKSTEWFRDGSALLLYRLNGNREDCGKRYLGEGSSNTQYADDSFFLYDSIVDMHPKSMINDKVEMNILPVDWTNCSISFWVYMDSDTDQTCTVLNGNSGEQPRLQADVYIDGPNGSYISVHGSELDTWATSNTGIINSKKWEHITINIRNRVIRMYVNGEDVTDTPGLTNATVSRQHFSVEIMDWSSSVSSKLEHIRVFRRGLAPLEIESLYTERKKLNHW